VPRHGLALGARHASGESGEGRDSDADFAATIREDTNTLPKHVRLLIPTTRPLSKLET
jgi:hypothetical protein